MCQGCEKKEMKDLSNAPHDGMHVYTCYGLPSLQEEVHEIFV